jgi:hypothetical protein
MLEWFGAAAQEITLAFSSRLAPGDPLDGQPPAASRWWLLRASAAGLIVGLAFWTAGAVLAPRGGRSTAVIVGYAGLAWALITALIWAGLFTASRMSTNRRKRGA